MVPQKMKVSAKYGQFSNPRHLRFILPTAFKASNSIIIKCVSLSLGSAYAIRRQISLLYLNTVSTSSKYHEVVNVLFSPVHRRRCKGCNPVSENDIFPFFFHITRHIFCQRQRCQKLFARNLLIGFRAISERFCALSQQQQQFISVFPYHTWPYLFLNIVSPICRPRVDSQTLTDTPDKVDYYYFYYYYY